MGLWDTITDAFSRDGVVTRFTEKVPVVGLITAGVQAISGNGEHAKRALANQANSILTTAGTVGGFVVGGPVGAVAGGALGSSVGIGAEYAVSTTIDDKEVKGSTGDVSVTRFVLDGALAGATGLVGGGGSTAVAKQVGSTLSKGVLTEVGGSFVKTGLVAAGGQAVQAVVDTATSTITGGSGKQAGGDIETGPQDPEPTEELVRAVTVLQAQAGQIFVRQLKALAIDYADYSPAHRDGSLTDLTNNLGALAGYFQVNVRHAQTLNRWQAAKGDFLTKVDGPARRLDQVKQNIVAATAADLVLRQKLLDDFNERELAIRQRLPQIDERLAGEANYVVPKSALVPPIL